MNGPLPGGMPFVSLCRDGFVAITSTRQGGRSENPYLSLNLGLHVGDAPERVLENRQAFWEAKGLQDLRPVCLQQVHGHGMETVRQEHAGRGWADYGQSLEGCDAALCSEPGLGLCIGHADCLALVLADPVLRKFGVAHAGWRGALAGLPLMLAQALAAGGSRMQDLRAGISPNLHPCCLKLGEPQKMEFAKKWQDFKAWGSEELDGGFRLSLNRLCIQQLVQAGLLPENIEVQSFCTGCNPALFFSHRRDKGITGRMWTVAGFTR
jgi:YfiH family protein